MIQEYLPNDLISFMQFVVGRRFPDDMNLRQLLTDAYCLSSGMELPSIPGAGLIAYAYMHEWVYNNWHWIRTAGDFSCRLGEGFASITFLGFQYTVYCLYVNEHSFEYKTCRLIYNDCVGERYGTT